MNKRLLTVTSFIAGLLVLAAAGAQTLIMIEPACNLEAPFTCDGFVLTGNTLAIDVSGPTAEDVRVIATGNECQAERAFFSEFEGKGTAEFSCNDLRPGDKAYLSVLYDANGQRNAASGVVVVG